MTNEQLLMQKRAGLITENEYQEAVAGQQPSAPQQSTVKKEPTVSTASALGQKLIKVGQELRSGEVTAQDLPASEIAAVNTLLDKVLGAAKKPGNATSTLRQLNTTVDTKLKSAKLGEETGAQLNENQDVKDAYKSANEWDKASNDWSNAITGKGPNGKDTGGVDFYKNDKELPKLFDDFHSAKIKLLRRLYDLSIGQG